MRNVRKPITAMVAVLGLLAFTAAPALAKEGLGVVEHIGGPGSSPGELSFVPLNYDNHATESGSGVAVSSTGDVYVADTGNNRVEWFVFNAGTKAYEYGGQFNGSGILTNEGGKKAPEPLSKPEAIAIDNDSTSPSKGDVYVVDERQGVVDKFSATGEFIFQLKVPSASGIAIDPSGDVWVRTFVYGEANVRVSEFNDAVDNVSMTSSPLEFPDANSSLLAVDSKGDLYVNQSTNEVEKFSDTGTGLGQVCGSCATGFGIDPTTDDLFVDGGTFIRQFGPFGEPFGEPLAASKPNTVGDGAGLAVSPTNHEIYVADAANNDIVIFADGPGPEAPETLGAKEVKGNSAVLEGELNPLGETGEVKYHFVYSTEGTCTGEANAGTAPVPTGTFAEASKALVHVEATNLVPLSEYTYCLAAENNFTEGDIGELSPPKTFNTPAAAPLVISERAFNTARGEGGFAAKINPNNEETTYFFEYSKKVNPSNPEELEGAEKTGEETRSAAFEEEEVEARAAEETLEPPKDTFYYRVVATNGAGETKGKVQAYTDLPLVENESVSALTSISATLEATVNPVFIKRTAYAFEYATEAAALGTSQATVVGQGKLTGEEEERLTGTEGVSYQFPISAVIVSLQPGETYYYRAVAENEISEYAGNANKGKPIGGEIKEFTAPAGPAATTGEAQNITDTSATLSGVVDPAGTETSYSFQYISEAGYQAAIAKGAANPYAEGETTAPVSAGAGDTAEAVGPIPADDLLPGTPYRYRLVATNKSGVQSIGSDGTFTTGSATPPAVSTGGASGVSQNSATLSGTVTTNGLQTNYGFEIGTAPGVYGPATGLGAIGGAQTEEVHVTLGELQPGTTYYYRVEATNADGTEKGQPGSFTTPGFPTLIAPPASPSLIAYTAPAFPKEEKASGTTVKTLTNKEKLAKALKTCKQDKSKTKRTKCEAAAHKKYPVASKKKGKKKK